MLLLFPFTLIVLSLPLSLFRVGYHRVILGEHDRGSNVEPIQVKLVSKVKLLNDFSDERKMRDQLV